MLGMMNCPSDNVEFYQTPDREEAQDTDVQVFIEQKERPQVSYTDHGRKLLDGLPEPSEPPQEAEKLWSDLLMRSRAQQVKSDIERDCLPQKPAAKGPKDGKVKITKPLTILEAAARRVQAGKRAAQPQNRK
uniref:DNA topoisomerase III n=2 Tax=Steinernema glaseri TaxID=37863 RepID=A0A1I7ZQH2_9BILA